MRQKLSCNKCTSLCTVAGNHAYMWKLFVYCPFVSENQSVWALFKVITPGNRCAAFSGLVELAQSHLI